MGREGHGNPARCANKVGWGQLVRTDEKKDEPRM